MALSPIACRCSLLANNGRVISSIVSFKGQCDGKRHRSSSSGQQQHNGGNTWKWVVAGGAAVAGAGMYLKYRSQTNVVVAAAAATAQPKAIEDTGFTAGLVRKDLPTYTEDDVAKHNAENTGIWVFFKNGVYDISKYVPQHPGGTKILMGAGKSIEPYWELYGVHKCPEIMEILEKYRIGNIVVVQQAKRAFDDPYVNDPNRNPVLIPSSSRPFNAEPPPSILVDNFITPSELFFVRNHLPVPKVDINKYALQTGIEDAKKQISLNLKDLKRNFRPKTVTSVVQCAGNRRSEMSHIKKVKGLNWNSAAISNATWTGVTLNDILKHAGIDIDKVDCQHVQFEGMDLGPEGAPYGASIPIDIARNLKDEIIIAYEMNGKDIPLDHGYPVRAVIPGIVGARQVKWLNKIVLSNEESTSHWQRRDYKGFNSSVDWHNVDFDKAVSIQQLPVISAICDPADGAELEKGATEVTVKGYAWSGGGRGIVRVDVSADGGKTWHVADLEHTEQSPYKTWAWTLWDAHIPLPEGHTGKVELICKAIDISYNCQPDNVEGLWNLRGVLNNSWHRVGVKVPPQ